MHAAQRPSEELFVVHTKHGKEKIQQQLKNLGEVEELKGGNDILLLHIRQKNPDAKSAWELIRKKIGAEIVHPVLLDESGYHQYPTGEISVRFQSNLSDSQLKRFAASHNLRLQSRNEYIPQQVIFEPLKPSERYFPELVEEIASAKNVQLAWANTLLRYERL